MYTQVILCGELYKTIGKLIYYSTSQWTIIICQQKKTNAKTSQVKKDNKSKQTQSKIDNNSKWDEKKQIGLLNASVQQASTWYFLDKSTSSWSKDLKNKHEMEIWKIKLIQASECVNVNIVRYMTSYFFYDWYQFFNVCWKNWTVVKCC